MLAPRRTTRAGVAALLTVALAGGLAGCTGDSSEDSGPPEPASTPLSAYDATDASVARGAFCDLVDDEAVADVLGAEPRRELAWGDGDRMPFGDRDVAHEWGCEAIGEDGLTLRAWVFAPPVDRGRARALARDLGGETCRALPGGEGFGDPTSSVTCQVGSRATLVRHAGLVDDAWLTCELYAPRRVASEPDDLADRAGRWCVAVLEAASATG
jgi:hypothetical protein